MTITTHWPIPTKVRTGRRAFTLVELMIGASLGAVVMTGVMSTFLFLGRSSANIRNYSDMETQARRALETFAEDTRQASAVTWVSSTSLTLVVNATNISYVFDVGAPNSAGVYNAGRLTRTVGGTATTLLTGITSFNFQAYTITGALISDFSSASARTTANGTTKQLQISLSAVRSTQTVASATNIGLSARYVMRNKRVTA